MLINQNSISNNSSIYVIYDLGSQIETEGTFGSSHLWEHLQFKDIEQYMDEYDEYGVVLNGYTSCCSVVFYLENLDDELAPFVLDFVNGIVNCEISEEDFNKEKGIVLSELSMSYGSRDEQFALNYDRYFFNGKSNPIGRADDIKNITYEDFMTFKNKFYKSPTKVIYTSKSYEIDPADLEFDFADPKDFENDIQTIDSITVPEDFEVELMQDYSDSDNCNMVIMNEKIIETDFPQLQVINKMLAGGLNSPLMNEIREKNSLCYSLSLALVPINEKQCTINFYIDCDYKDIEQVEELFFDIINKSKEYITTEMLDRRKKKEDITQQKIEIDLYSVPDYNLYPEFDSKEFLVDFSIEDVHNLLDEYYIDQTYIVTTDKDLY